jgi:hypothetical protein
MARHVVERLNAAEFADRKLKGDPIPAAWPGGPLELQRVHHSRHTFARLQRDRFDLSLDSLLPGTL